LGFNTMVLIYPKEILGGKQNWKNFLDLISKNEELLTEINKKLKSFYEWNLKKKEMGKECLGCSFSNSFYKTKEGKSISGLKYCFVSPYTDLEGINKETKKLERSFKEFIKEEKCI